jgi:hypothetical protein
MGHVHGLAAVLTLDKSLELKDACVDVGFEVVNFFARVLLSNLAHLGSIRAGGWGGPGMDEPLQSSEL